MEKVEEEVEEEEIGALIPHLYIGTIPGITIFLATLPLPFFLCLPPLLPPPPLLQQVWFGCWVDG